MGYNRATPTEAPSAYHYGMRLYGKSLRPVVVAIALITAIWALAWTVSSFKQLELDDSDRLLKLAPLAIAQGVMYAVACAFQTFGVFAAGSRRVPLIRIYAFLCALSALLVIGVSVMRVIAHFVFKSDLITECTDIVQTGSIGSVFGIWGTNPPTDLNANEAVQYCDDQWNNDSWAEIIALILVMLLGLLFTSFAFAYYRQALDPNSPANAFRVPPGHARGNNHPTHYDPPYDRSAYAPVYLPPPGPPPADGKPPEYKSAPYSSYGEDKDAKDHDPFGDFEGPSVPMPTHWVEDREGTSV